MEQHLVVRRPAVQLEVEDEIVIEIVVAIGFGFGVEIPYLVPFEVAFVEPSSCSKTLSSL